MTDAEKREFASSKFQEAMQAKRGHIRRLAEAFDEAMRESDPARRDQRLRGMYDSANAVNLEQARARADLWADIASEIDPPLPVAEP